jgi:hypothetical protein
MHSGIVAVAEPCSRPPCPRDSQVYDARSFEVSDLAAADEQRRLVAESRRTLLGMAGAEHSVDESAPEPILPTHRHTEDCKWDDGRSTDRDRTGVDPY